MHSGTAVMQEHRLQFVAAKNFNGREDPQGPKASGNRQSNFGPTGDMGEEHGTHENNRPGIVQIARTTLTVCQAKELGDRLQGQPSMQGFRLSEFLSVRVPGDPPPPPPPRGPPNKQRTRQLLEATWLRNPKTCQSLQVIQGPWDIVPIGGCGTPSHYRWASLSRSVCVCVCLSLKAETVGPQGSQG